MEISIFEILEQELLWNGHVKIIGYQFGAKFKLVFCAKYDRELDLGFWEILYIPVSRYIFFTRNKCL
jgi:hypothetical protein